MTTKGKTNRKSKRQPSRGTKKNDLRNKPDNYLECRSVRHKWNTRGFFHFRHNRGQGICRVLECERCPMTREDYFSPNGVKVDMIYRPPDDYALSGDGKITSTDLNREVIRRVERIYDSSDDLPGRRPSLRVVAGKS